jgi:hypothetical protein
MKNKLNHSLHTRGDRGRLTGRISLSGKKSPTPSFIAIGNSNPKSIQGKMALLGLTHRGWLEVGSNGNRAILFDLKTGKYRTCPDERYRWGTLKASKRDMQPLGFWQSLKYRRATHGALDQALAKKEQTRQDTLAREEIGRQYRAAEELRLATCLKSADCSCARCMEEEREERDAENARLNAIKDAVEVQAEVTWGYSSGDIAGAQVGRDPDGKYWIRSCINSDSLYDIGDEDWEPLLDIQQVNTMVSNLDGKSDNLIQRAKFIATVQGFLKS